MDILERLRYWSRVAPAHPAHNSGGYLLSYRDLDANSDALAVHLSAFQPDNHLPVVVIGHKEPEMLVAFLAAVKSGHPYIPIDISTPGHRVDKIVELSQSV
jgi:D-alanine--poly(phosphoribitol) ligase subunit 1